MASIASARMAESAAGQSEPGSTPAPLARERSAAETAPLLRAEPSLPRKTGPEDVFDSLEVAGLSVGQFRV